VGGSQYAVATKTANMTALWILSFSMGPAT
jgi:hypothetical protein